MTSHRDMIEGRSKDELGALIRWSLEARVAGAYPPPEVWQRVLARAQRPTVWTRLRSHRGYRATMAQISRVGVFLAAQIDSWMRPRDRLVATWGEGGLDPRLARFLFDQCGFYLLRLAF